MGKIETYNIEDVIEEAMASGNGLARVFKAEYAGYFDVLNKQLLVPSGYELAIIKKENKEG